MQQKLHKVSILALVASHGGGGVGVFLHARARTFLIQVDPYQGQMFELYRQGAEYDRPLTHDLFSSLIRSIGGELERVVIHEMDDEVFFAQMRVRCEDPLGRVMILDLDCRPSDGLILAQLEQKPLYATDTLLEKVEDSSALLEEIQQSQIEELLEPMFGPQLEKLDEVEQEEEFDEDLFGQLDVDEDEEEDED